MNDDRILRTLRMQAWERTKGELNAILSTYWGEPEKFPEMYKITTDFIKHIEDNGLQE
jgi:hypothetical protein